MKKSLIFCILSLLAISSFAQLNEKVGIGVRLQIDSSRGYKTTLVIALVPNGAAEAAGLKEGDFILKVNEQSTRDVALADVVAMIVGDEGTEVRLVVERGASTLNFKMLRGKYKYAESYYLPAVKDDPFCTALASLMNDGPYDFINTKDSTRYRDEEGAFGRRYYESKVKIPGAEKVSMMSSFGITCEIEFGTFNSEDEINAAGEKIVGQIQTCFPDYYYKPVLQASGSNKVQIGKNLTDGFESAILEIFSYFDKTAHTYKLTMRVNGGKATRYYTIATAAQDNGFAKSLRTIYDDILNSYKNVKGTKHENPGAGPFSMPTWWYEVSPLPEGAHDCSIQEGGLSMGNGCRCRFFSGDDRQAAVDAYTKLFEVMRDALGSEFTYSLDKPELDMTIPSDAEAVVTFGIKKERTYESGALLSLVFIKDANGRYAVNMLFHKFGF